MDDMTVRTPTQSELATFQVMANMDFVDLHRPKPRSENILPRVEEDIYPDEAATEVPPPSPPREPTPVLTPRNITPPPSPLTPKVTPKVTPPAPNPFEPLYAKAKQMSDIEIMTEKEGLLMELQMMEKQGLLKLPRAYSMEDSLEELQFQVDRANSNYSAMQAVDLAKTGIRVGSTALEMLMKRLGINVLEGFSNNLCKDMNKFTKPLTKMYRKYWRRGGITNPETELLMIVLGSLAMTVVQNKNLTGMMGGLGGLAGLSGMMPQAPQPPPAPVKLRPPVVNMAPSWQPEPVPPEIFEKPSKTITIGTPSTATKRKPKETPLEL
jgi:hypothetical protein